MKIKHFIYGKFSSKLPDFGVRVSDIESFTNKGINGFSDIISYFQNHFRPIFYNGSFPKSNPEIIAKVKDKYVYAKFYPAFEEQRGTNIECLFHAFLFTRKDMELINYCPWRLKRNFIKEFNSSEIIGQDDEVWLKADQCGVEEYNRRIDIDIDLVNSGKSVDKFYEGHSDYYTIVDKDPESILTRLDVEIRLSLFSSGIFLNGDGNLLNNIYSKRIHFVFLSEALKDRIPDLFRNLSRQELNQLIPVESTESLVHVIQGTKPGDEGGTEIRPIVINNEPVIDPELNIVKYEDGNISIRWMNRNNIKVAVIIERKSSNDKQFYELPHNIVLEPHSECIFTDPEVKNGEEYIYRLQHYIAGTIPVVDHYTVTPSIITTPFPVDGNTFKCSFNSENRQSLKVNLSWMQPKNSYPVAYSIYRVRLDDLKKVPVVSNLSSESYTDTNDLELTSYSYSIKVVEPKSGLVSQSAQTTCDPNKSIKLPSSSKVLKPLLPSSETKTNIEQEQVKKQKKQKKYLFATGLSLAAVLTIFCYLFFRIQVHISYESLHLNEINKILLFKSQNKCDSVLNSISKLTLDSVLDNKKKMQLITAKKECEEGQNVLKNRTNYDALHAIDINIILNAKNSCENKMESFNKIILDSIIDHTKRDKILEIINKCRQQELSNDPKEQETKPNSPTKPKKRDKDKRSIPKPVTI